MSRYWGDNNGFSLVEALTVISILAIMTIIALPNYVQWRSDAKYKETALGMFNHLREARSRAITSNVEYRVTFDIDPGQYQMERGNSSSGSTSWSPVFAWVSLPESHNIASGVGCDQTADVPIVFKPNGASSTTAIMCVLTNSNIPKFKVSIASAASGRVVVEKQP